MSLAPDRMAPVAPTAVPTAGSERTANPLFAVRPHGRTRRLAELVVAGTSLVLLAPLMGAIALLVALTSDGPVFFRHRRVGHGGVPFEVIKFRTMYDGAEAQAARIFAEANHGSGPLDKRRDDPRVTAVGRWLRRSSLDELPQLLNVLDGSMALVGPRPSSPAEVVRFAPDEVARLGVRPGITGLAQVSGRSDLGWEEGLRLDLEYIERRSLWLDLLILIRTPFAVVGGRGAY
ncbi:sugar transferase [Nocardioides sp. LML1-1-1.1]|uniref:sugar transferase n=1 Tax=Nocardioides sp. LML1-1-1.1 TaxID=3135248 RepID=UPI003412CBD4